MVWNVNLFLKKLPFSIISRTTCILCEFHKIKVAVTPNVCARPNREAEQLHFAMELLEFLLCLLAGCLAVTTALKSQRLRTASGFRLLFIESILSFSLAVTFLIECIQSRGRVTAFILALGLLLTCIWTIAVSYNNFLRSNDASDSQLRRTVLRNVSIGLSTSLIPLAITISRFTDRGAAPECLFATANRSIMTIAALTAYLGLALVLVMVLRAGKLYPSDRIHRYAYLMKSVSTGVCLAVALLAIKSFYFYSSATFYDYPVPSLSEALSFGDYCTTIFPTVSMFYLIVGCTIVGGSALGLPSPEDMSMITLEHNKFLDTVAFAILHPLIIMMLGSIRPEHIINFLVIAVPQIAVLLFPYFKLYATQTKNDHSTEGYVPLGY